MRTGQSPKVENGAKPKSWERGKAQKICKNILVLEKDTTSISMRASQKDKNTLKGIKDVLEKGITIGVTKIGQNTN